MPDRPLSLTLSITRMNLRLIPGLLAGLRAGSSTGCIVETRRLVPIVGLSPSVLLRSSCELCRSAVSLVGASTGLRISPLSLSTPCTCGAVYASGSCDAGCPVRENKPLAWPGIEGWATLCQDQCCEKPSRVLDAGDIRGTMIVPADPMVARSCALSER